MTSAKDKNSYKDSLSKLPKLESIAHCDENGNIKSISVQATDKPLYTEEQLSRFDVPKFLWKRVR